MAGNFLKFQLIMDYAMLNSGFLDAYMSGRTACVTCLDLAGRADRFQPDQPIAELQFRQQVPRGDHAAAGNFMPAETDSQVAESGVGFSK
ncbi:hypothetical protein [Burkholderia pyrrocinia]|uniref:hypothetical protein n=1 Tax=Burkholderia pyrrocinia TaxID=60550 RepID=UPI0030D1D120